MQRNRADIALPALLSPTDVDRPPLWVAISVPDRAIGARVDDVVECPGCGEPLPTVDVVIEFSVDADGRETQSRTEHWREVKFERLPDGRYVAIDPTNGLRSHECAHRAP